MTEHDHRRGNSAETGATESGHSHQDHSHDYRGAGRRSLIIVLVLLACHMAIEISGGILSGSPALLSDAAL